MVYIIENTFKADILPSNLLIELQIVQDADRSDAIK
jgi:hypothetical protein